MVESDSEIEQYDIDNLITKIGEIDLQDTFINLKADVKQEATAIDWNPNITDTPSSSRNPPGPRNTGFNKPTKGYAGISPLIRPKDNFTPIGSMANEPINPFGIYLNLDCVTNTEEAIDKWETTLRIAVSVNKMDTETTRHFIERSLVNSALRFWQNLDEESRQTIFSTDDNLANIISRATEAFRLEFVGEGNFLKDPATISKYTIALLRLQLCDICEIDRYICVFQDYYYHIYNRVSNMESYLPLFFSKIPDPWGKKLIDTYQPGTSDTLGKRITHLKDKLSEWCGDAILAKMTRGLRKRISLCCDNTKMPLMIGCDSPHYYNKIKRKYKKRKHYKKRYFKKRKARYYKRKGYVPRKTFYKRKKKDNKKPTECRCYYCHEIGHYANKCPKKFDRNKRKIEIDDDIDLMIDQGDFVQINEFEDITSDESIFILTDTEYSSSEDEKEL